MSVDSKTIQRSREILLAPLKLLDDLRGVERCGPRQVVRVTDFAPETPDEEFLEEAYTKILGRKPRESCRENWLPHLKSRGLSRIELLQQLSSSEEGALYRTAICGLSYAVEQVQNAHRLPKRMRSKAPHKFAGKQLADLLAAEELDRAKIELEANMSQLATSCIAAIEDVQQRAIRNRPGMAFVELPDERTAGDELSDKVGSPYVFGPNVDRGPDADIEAGLLGRFQQQVHAHTTRSSVDGRASSHKYQLFLDQVCSSSSPDADSTLRCGYIGDDVIAFSLACRHQGLELSFAQVPVAHQTLAKYLGIDEVSQINSPTGDRSGHSAVQALFIELDFASADDQVLLQVLSQALPPEDQPTQIAFGKRNDEIVGVCIRSGSLTEKVRILSALQVLGFDVQDGMQDDVTEHDVVIAARRSPVGEARVA